jgi:hypothetical protein
VEGHGVRVQSASREAQLAFCCEALDVLPASSVLKTLRMSHLHGRHDERPGANRVRSHAGAIQAIFLRIPGPPVSARRVDGYIANAFALGLDAALNGANPKQ